MSIERSEFLIYFVTQGQYVKIGFTDKILRHRISQLNVSSPDLIYAIGYIKNGNLELEKQLHKRFANLHVHGEWFEANIELIQFINSNNDMPVYVDWLDEKLVTYKKIDCA